MKIKWASDVAKQDYPAAERYLTLLFKKAEVERLLKRLRSAAIESFAAKDVLRAAGLEADMSSDSLTKEKRKVESGEKLSPILLVRDERNGRLIIADGYHRVCVTYLFSEESKVPVKLV
jgi:hypothetical protein